jgi:diacylglycerol kinase family enzyme
VRCALRVALGEFKKLVKILEESKIKVTELKTERPGHATTLALETPMDGHHAFIVIGGDGSVTLAPLCSVQRSI